MNLFLLLGLCSLFITTTYARIIRDHFGFPPIRLPPPRLPPPHRPFFLKKETNNPMENRLEYLELKVIGEDNKIAGLFRHERQQAHNVLEAFKRAVTYGDRKAADYLLDLGANINEHFRGDDLKGRTALHIAAEKGYLSVLKELIKRGASINSVDDHGSSPLHYAAYNGQLPTTLALLDAGANVKLRNKAGTTAFEDAQHQDHQDVADEIKKYYPEDDSDIAYFEDTPTPVKVRPLRYIPPMKKPKIIRDPPRPKSLRNKRPLPIIALKPKEEPTPISEEDEFPEHKIMIDPPRPIVLRDRWPRPIRDRMPIPNIIRDSSRYTEEPAEDPIPTPEEKEESPEPIIIIDPPRPRQRIFGTRPRIIRDPPRIRNHESSINEVDDIDSNSKDENDADLVAAHDIEALRVPFFKKQHNRPPLAY